MLTIGCILILSVYDDIARSTALPSLMIFKAIEIMLVALWDHVTKIHGRMAAGLQHIQALGGNLNRKSRQLNLTIHKPTRLPESFFDI